MSHNRLPSRNKYSVPLNLSIFLCVTALCNCSIELMKLTITSSFFQAISLFQQINFSLGSSFLIFGIIHLYIAVSLSNRMGQRFNLEFRTPSPSSQPDELPRQDDVPTVMPIAKKPFNLVFHDDEVEGYKVKGFPLCFFCEHNIINIAFTPRGEPKSIATFCEEAGEDCMVWDGNAFSNQALLNVNDNITLSWDDMSCYINSCKEFKPNLLLWQEGHAIKLGEFEILGKTISDRK